MGRFTAQVGPGVPTGLYDLEFTRSDGGSPDYPSPVVGNSGAVDQCVLYSPTGLCTLRGGNSGYRQNAVNAACPLDADVEIISSTAPGADCTSAPPSEIDASTPPASACTHVGDPQQQQPFWLSAAWLCCKRRHPFNRCRDAWADLPTRSWGHSRQSGYLWFRACPRSSRPPRSWLTTGAPTPAL